MARTKQASAAAKAGDFDGHLRGSQPGSKFCDFDPRGAFNAHRMTEIDWPEFKAGYEAGYKAALKQLGRSPECR